jgi:hypothetical protein
MLPSMTLWGDAQTTQIIICFQWFIGISQMNEGASRPSLTYLKRHKRETLFTLCCIRQCTGFSINSSNLCN